MKQIKQPALPLIPLTVAGICVITGISLLLVYLNKPADNKSFETGDKLPVIDGTGSDPRQQQASGSVLQGAARVGDLQGKEGSAVQQSQGVQQGPTSIDELLRDKEIQ